MTLEQQNPVSASAPTPAQRKTIQQDLFVKFVDLIYEISGIRFTDAKMYFLASKLDNRVQANGLDGYEAYYRFLLQPSSKIKEHPELLNEITINETFFFRNQPQLDAFAQEILKPMLAKRRQEGKMTLRIWSCAASTGDEAYTTALQLMQMEEASGFRIEIIGTDICPNAIKQAKDGVYKRYAVRNIPPALLQRYFTEDNGNFYISDEIKRRVRFTEGNLMDSAKVRMLGKFDIAFCRNVLIYFDNASKEKVLTNINHALNDDGILLVGHSENLYSHRHLFKANKDSMNALAYHKAPPGTAKLDV